MIKSRHNPVHEFILGQYLLFILKKHFRAVCFRPLPAIPDKPILLLGNHFSWWDGFIPWYINRTAIHKKIHVLMLDEELEKNRVLRNIGAFSIRKKSRDMLQTFSYIKWLLKNPENMIVIFPQGQIYSLYQQEILFKKGIFKALQGIENDHEVWFSVVLPEYGDQKKPTLHCYMKKHGDGLGNGEETGAAYQSFYQECMQGQVARTREKYKA